LTIENHSAFELGNHNHLSSRTNNIVNVFFDPQMKKTNPCTKPPKPANIKLTTSPVVFLSGMPCGHKLLYALFRFFVSPTIEVVMYSTTPVSGVLDSFGIGAAMEDGVL